jgi:hypothetical protein
MINKKRLTESIRSIYIDEVLTKKVDVRIVQNESFVNFYVTVHTYYKSVTKEIVFTKRDRKLYSVNGKVTCYQWEKLNSIRL